MRMSAALWIKAPRCLVAQGEGGGPQMRLEVKALEASRFCIYAAAPPRDTS
jgi:hypothetical protein